MKKMSLVLILAVITFLGCEPQTGSVFDDHDGVAYDDGSGLSDPMDGKDFYFGNLHSHSRYSDGQGTPAQAFSWARDTAGYDFYAITDHAILVDFFEWCDTGNQADAYTQTGEFVAIRGFEYSHFEGHACVWDTNDYTSILTSPTMSSFVDWLARRDGFAQFNHPGREPSTFHDFSYEGSVTENAVAIETGNKEVGNIDGEFLRYYDDALSRGWRVAPTNNQDNHSLSTNSHRTVIISDELRKSSLLDALEARRVYSSDDPDMRVLFKVGAHFMGEVVDIQSGDYQMTVEVEDDEPIILLEIIDRKGNVVASTVASSTEVSWTPTLTVTSDNWYYLKVTQEDTNNDEPSHSNQVAVTAPIWLNVQSGWYWRW